MSYELVKTGPYGRSKKGFLCEGSGKEDTGFAARVDVPEFEENGKIENFEEKPKLEKPVGIAIVALEGSTLKDIDHVMCDKRERGKLAP